MDLTTGKIVNAVSKGCTDAIGIGVDSQNLPQPIKKFLNSLLTNVDDMIEEQLVLSKMERKFDEIKPQAIEAPVTKRPDAVEADQASEDEAAYAQGYGVKAPVAGPEAHF
jgi:hypothetical protein